MMHVYGLCKEPVCLAEGASKRSRVSIDATCCNQTLSFHGREQGNVTLN
jgi:hypothetical protein